jgi:amino-acid N-acetyltransferase
LGQKGIIRKANIGDIIHIHKLINHFAGQDKMLPRSLSELYETTRDFLVYEEEHKVWGCVALHMVWEDLAEIKCLAIEEAKQKRGIAGRLLKRSLAEAKELGIKKIFALTYEVSFFKKYGFGEIDKSKLPHKIWGECIKCPKFPNCDETALAVEF